MSNKTTKKKPEPVGMVSTSHRFDPKKLKRASELKIDVSEVVRRALDKAIAQVSGECPTCGAKRK